MSTSIRDFLRVLLLLPTVWIVACATGEIAETTTGSSSSSGSGSTGTGGSDLGPCGVDCSGFETPECTVSVCNTGQWLGPLNTCIVVPAPKGTSCDDGQFCTTNDACDNGTCVGGTKNTCGLTVAPCSAVIC